MKRVIVFLVALIALVFIVSADCGNSDINWDGVVDSYDMNRLSGHYGINGCSADNSFCSWTDVNRDGDVDILDVNILASNLGEDCWQGSFDNCDRWKCEDHSCRYTSCDDDHEWKHHHRNYQDRYDNYFQDYVPAASPETVTKIIYVPQSSQPVVQGNSVDLGLDSSLIVYVMLGLIVLLLIIILVVMLVRR